MHKVHAMSNAVLKKGKFIPVVTGFVSRPNHVCNIILAIKTTLRIGFEVEISCVYHTYPWAKFPSVEIRSTPLNINSKLFFWNVNLRISSIKIKAIGLAPIATYHHKTQLM
jgi:hypothetical protein